MVELIDTNAGQIARIFPTGENMSYQTVQHNNSANDDQLRFITRTKQLSRKVLIAANNVMPPCKWLSGLSLVTLIGALVIFGCNSKNSNQQDNESAVTKPLHKEVGEASWYGPGFQGQETANGETFNKNEMTAAHPSLPMGTMAKVTNLENGKKVDVKINDRGPFAGNRAIDLSSAAANKLDMKKGGTTEVKIETKPVKRKSSTRKSSKKKLRAKRDTSSN